MHQSRFERETSKIPEEPISDSEEGNEINLLSDEWLEQKKVQNLHNQYLRTPNGGIEVSLPKRKTPDIQPASFSIRIGRGIEETNLPVFEKPEITIESMREMFGKAFEGYSDEELQRIIESGEVNRRLYPESQVLKFNLLIAANDYPPFIQRVLENSQFPSSNHQVELDRFYLQSSLNNSLNNLTVKLCQTTTESYDQHSEEYSLVEWSQDMVYKTHFDTRRPFLIALMALKKTSGPILFAGCGSGRDIDYMSQDFIDIQYLYNNGPFTRLQRKGIKKIINLYQKQIKKVKINPSFIGVDYSQAMLNIAQKKVQSPAEFTLDDISLLESIQNESINAIFCESAITHLPFEKIKVTLQRFYDVLQPDGIALIGFRTKKTEDSSSTYSTYDRFGERNYSVQTEEEQQSLLIEAGFTIIYKKRQPHPDPNRPDFTNYIVQKKTDKSEVSEEVLNLLRIISMTSQEARSFNGMTKILRNIKKDNEPITTITASLATSLIRHRP